MILLAGLPYRYDETQLLGPERECRGVNVNSYQIKGETWYSIIKARRPSTWKYALNSHAPVRPSVVNVRHSIFLRRTSGSAR